MAKTKKNSSPSMQSQMETIKDAKLLAEQNGTIVLKATRPLNAQEHRQLSDKIRYEAEKSGFNIILMPYTCELVGDTDAG